MAIAGIGAGIGLNISPARQDLIPASERNNNAASRQTDSSSVSNVINRDGSQQVGNTGARFDPPSAGNRLNANSQERRNPADIEALRNQFGLQSDSSPTIPNRAVESFVSVAEFEERDAIASATGIDIFV